MKAILTVGVSASGKTTWAEQFVKENEGWVNINRDDIRFTILGERDWSKWNWKNEKRVTTVQEQLIFDAAIEEKNIIISDTNLNKKFREQMIQKLEEKGYTVTLKMFPVSFEEAVKRDTQRANGVGYSVIAKQYEQWEEQFEEEKYQYTKNLPYCIIVDIDGTLAHMDGRGAYDWERVGEDNVDLAVRAIVNDTYNSSQEVFLFSGRDSVCEKATQYWLQKHAVSYNYLVMREQGDSRKDTIVKKEMFDKYIKGKYNVLYVVDDRPCVCRMWRSLGLKVMQVGNPYIEF